MDEPTADILWTIAGERYVVTTTEDTIRSVRLAVATVQTESARREFFAGFWGEREDAFWEAVEAAFAREEP